LIEIFNNINEYYLLIWGLGIGDWGLGIGDWAQSPIPNPHPHILYKYNFKKKKLKNEANLYL